MESRAKFLGHPLHQMLVVFPLGLFAAAVGFDLAALWRHDASLFVTAFQLIRAGLVLAAIAAVFGYIDWRAIPANTRARQVGALHAVGNVIVLVLFAVSWSLRRDDPAVPSTVAWVLSLAAFALAGVTGWLGGELVDRHRIGVADDAGLDAPSSLSTSRQSRTAA